ncbi:hypothetical protein DFH08DRAFT_959880 [Mycena albidolilacea]|uniref:Uncharacterized protein n=1 Tax=Mycena albidolilacea TaxID=1033008 RepID=A0AAD7ERT9_9AGAR|nr:hypothetical protein DFH08DRAFT_959880 [Mycena albidolilacea]
MDPPPPTIREPRPHNPGLEDLLPLRHRQYQPFTGKLQAEGSPTCSGSDTWPDPSSSRSSSSSLSAQTSSANTQTGNSSSQITSSPSTGNPVTATATDSNSAGPSSSPIGASVTKSDRRTTHAAVIAGSVVSSCLLGGLLLLVLWLRRRRRRVSAETLFEPYTKAEMQISPPDTRAAPGFAPLELDAGNIGATAADASGRGAVRVQAEVTVVCTADDGPPEEDPLNLRIQRVEAQLEALLTSQVPQSAPPSYVSEGES